MCTTYSLERRRCKVDGKHCEKITNVQQRSTVDSRRCLTIDTQAAAGSRIRHQIFVCQKSTKEYSASQIRC